MRRRDIYALLDEGGGGMESNATAWKKQGLKFKPIYIVNVKNLQCTV